MRYCDVIVDIAADRVDRLYTYAIPEGMEVEPGHRVIVPFGPRKIEGYVISLKEDSELAPEKIRYIVRKLEEYTAVLPELIELAEWIHIRYRVCLSEALRLMIPAQLRGERVKEKLIHVAELTIEGEAIDAEIEKRARAPRQAELIARLRDGPLPVPVIAAQVKGASAALRALSEQGVVALREVEAHRRPYRALTGDRALEPELTRAQRRAVDALTEAANGDGGRFLLLGVTGSGKTEVYIHLIRRVMARGRTAIVLVPEIALTPQMVDWFRARFGDDAAVLHSGLSHGERFDEWRRIRLGRARVVIGARSAVFAPLQNIGAIIVDEEHEQTYLSDHRPCYDAREVAWKRCTQSGAVLLLGSATPSIASYMRTLPGVQPENRLTLLELNERALGQELPPVQIVDMRIELARGNLSIFSAALQAELSECLESGMQAILFINRRGYSTFVSCRACGYVERCDACDVSMTYHQVDDTLRCHYCGAQRRPPSQCPACGSGYIKYFGVGTQKVEEEIHKLFPGTRVARMDIDTTRKKDAHETILSAFRRGETQILVGTQMIAKGLDFPKVTLVGVVAADMTLNVPDYRSVERTFQLITQVAGRAGRAEHPGKVIVQTYEPEHYGIQLAAKQDYRAFFHQEARNRRRGLYPPYTVLARILCVSQDEGKAQSAAEGLAEKLDAFLDGPGQYREDVVQMRALEAPIKKIRNETRFQVYIKLYARGKVNEILSYMEELAGGEYEDVTLELLVNPVNML